MGTKVGSEALLGEMYFAMTSEQYWREYITLPNATGDGKDSVRHFFHLTLHWFLNKMGKLIIIIELCNLKVVEW